MSEREREQEQKQNIVAAGSAVAYLHGHAGDVPKLLQDLVWLRRVLVRLDCSQHRENLVDDFSRDEAAEVEVDILDKSAGEARDVGRDVGEDVKVAVQLVLPLLRLPPG